MALSEAAKRLLQVKIAESRAALNFPSSEESSIPAGTEIPAGGTPVRSKSQQRGTPSAALLDMQCKLRQAEVNLNRAKATNLKHARAVQQITSSNEPEPKKRIKINMIKDIMAERNYQVPESQRPLLSGDAARWANDPSVEEFYAVCKYGDQVAVENDSLKRKFQNLAVYLANAEKEVRDHTAVQPMKGGSSDEAKDSLADDDLTDFPVLAKALQEMRSIAASLGINI